VSESCRRAPGLSVRRQARARARAQKSRFHRASRPEADGPALRAATWMSTAFSRVRVPAGGDEEELDEEDCEREMEPGRLGARQSLRLSLLRSTPSSSEGRVDGCALPAVCEPELAVRRKVARASAWRGAPRSTLEVELAEGVRSKCWAAEGMLVA
jgi:hypothetical protein